MTSPPKSVGRMVGPLPSPPPPLPAATAQDSPSRILSGLGSLWAPSTLVGASGDRTAPPPHPSSAAEQPFKHASAEERAALEHANLVRKVEYLTLPESAALLRSRLAVLELVSIQVQFVWHAVRTAVQKCSPDVPPCIGFIGGGITGRHIINSLLHHGVDPRRVYVSTRRPASLAAYTTRGVNVMHDNARLVRRVRLVVIAVLPHQLAIVGDALRARQRRRCVIMSVVGGVPTKKIQQVAGTGFLCLTSAVDRAALERSARVAIAREVGAALEPAVGAAVTSTFVGRRGSLASKTPGGTISHDPTAGDPGLIIQPGPAAQAAWHLVPDVSGVHTLLSVIARLATRFGVPRVGAEMLALHCVLGRPIPKLHTAPADSGDATPADGGRASLPPSTSGAGSDGAGATGGPAAGAGADAGGEDDSTSPASLRPPSSHSRLSVARRLSLDGGGSESHPSRRCSVTADAMSVTGMAASAAADGCLATVIDGVMQWPTLTQYEVLQEAWRHFVDRVVPAVAKP